MEGWPAPRIQVTQRARLFHRWWKLRRSGVRAAAPTWPAGHYYSPLPSHADIDRWSGRSAGDLLDVPGVDLGVERQIALAGELAPIMESFDFPARATAGRRYWHDNDFFCLPDALVLGALMCRSHTKRVIEIGSGFSSACMLDVNEIHLDKCVDFTFVEPFPHDRLTPLLERGEAGSVELLAEPVQTLDPATFDVLDAGDILLIDSSHVSKYGSDVNYLFLEVLPRLRHGVLVHVHDVGPRFEYPIAWVRKLWGWNEAYLLRAFLAFNDEFEILLHPALLMADETLAARLPDVLRDAGPGGSIWLRRR